MAIFEHGSVSIEVDEDGFMQEPEKWNEEVAAALGSTEGVEDLTPPKVWKTSQMTTGRSSTTCVTTICSSALRR
jgi:sulfur relay (sulfurtransferase) DsrC/TusE family protein